MSTLLALILALVSLDEWPAHQLGVVTTPVRLVELTGDRLLDKLHLGLDGSLAVSVNLGGGVFDPIVQELPSVRVTDVLCGDLDGDGLPDLYLVSDADNMALVGDGMGRFSEATERLGLADGGPGVSAERVDLDGLGALDLLLHNTGGDVIFWAFSRRYRRDVGTPTGVSTNTATGLLALQRLVAQAAGLLALGPGQQIVLGLDESGQPTVAVGPTPSAPTLAPPATPGSAPPVSPLPDPVSGTSSVMPGPLLASNLRVTQPTSKRPGTSAVAPPPTQQLTPEQMDILSHMSIVYLDDGFGNLVNKTIRVSGVNWQIVNGLGATNGYPTDPDDTGTVNTVVDGVGNLLVGYNELGNPNGDDRTGSHNIVLGHGQSYTSFGGLVAAGDNTVSAPYATVSGGKENIAGSGFSSVMGGRFNTASGSFASIIGGRGNVASGLSASVSGGFLNLASGIFASMNGGQSNVAAGNFSSVSGGNARSASGTDDWVAGSLLEDN